MPREGDFTKVLCLSTTFRYFYFTDYLYYTCTSLHLFKSKLYKVLCKIRFYIQNTDVVKDPDEVKCVGSRGISFFKNIDEMEFIILITVLSHENKNPCVFITLE